MIAPESQRVNEAGQKYRYTWYYNPDVAKSTKKFCVFTEEVQMAKESLFLIPFDESAEQC